MKRIACILLVVTAAIAQQDRASYQAAYRGWRAADPDLERDAPSGDATLGARADKAAAEASKFFGTRKQYLDGLQADTEHKAISVDALPALPDLDSSAARYAASQNNFVSANIDAIANDPDRAIQRLRLALERERLALTALSSAVSDAQGGRDTVLRAAAAAEESRGKVTQRYRSLSASLKQTAELTVETATLWADYYRTFSDEARGVISRDPEPAAPVAATPATATPATATPATATPAPAAPAPATPAPATVTVVNPPVNPPAPPVPPAPDVPNNNPNAAPNNDNPPPALRTRSITPLPLSRYLGAWVYPTVGAEFHGPEPDSVDMIVHEENGQARGMLVARFKLSATDPILRLNFEGPFQSTRNQVFPLVTGKGAKGTVQLNPGSAFNLIEVSITTEDQPGAVHQAKFLLIKK